MDDFISNTMDSMGYLGVALLMFLENLFPPIPSEVVMPTAGANARSGDKSLVLMIVVGTLGTLAGAVPWYGIARWVGTDRFRKWIDRHGHWLGTDASEIDRADKWFDRYGYWAVTVGRLVPGVRTLISVPAGLSEMPFGPFLLATTIGTVAWTSLLAGLGYWLEGQSDAIARTLKIIGMGVIGVLFVLYIVKVVRHHHQRHRQTSS
ncbi:Inner membrane protein YghB [Maioricimonas rarisocia]|uniref:Inner membrane protein YghB n=1 Tax=Maioricimonas rarisocia TaxID=2528026 RepID=A0A517Z4U6_9PLAN|nr:DedA family protein [Maioricimonas rarisocia]QDU37498.1 Inner membrane protein YghB [Maioricimonas rarisocia]